MLGHHFVSLDVWNSRFFAKKKKKKIASHQDVKQFVFPPSRSKRNVRSSASNFFSSSPSCLCWYLSPPPLSLYSHHPVLSPFFSGWRNESMAWTVQPAHPWRKNKRGGEDFFIFSTDSRDWIIGHSAQLFCFPFFSSPIWFTIHIHTRIASFSAC